jgi:uroporphyrinogen decarboxylase
MSVHINDRHLKLAESIVANSHANGGLAEVDVEKFWEDNTVAHEKIWSTDCPQMPCGIQMGGETYFAELGMKEDWYKHYHDPKWLLPLKVKYNEVSLEIVGKKFLNESLPNPNHAWPAVKELSDIFEAENIWHNESYWLKKSVDSIEELKALLDRVERRLENLSEFILPDNWGEEKERLNALGFNSPIYRGQRGPVTFATSVFGVENLIFLCYDHAELAKRFSDLICKAILERAKVLDIERGYDENNFKHGWAWADDNCCMLSADLYEMFGFPILKKVFDKYSPNKGDKRFQHSDSEMRHLLPLLKKLNMTQVNLGPTLSVSEIREYLPNAIIDGQLAPFTFSRNEEVNIVAETLRDMEMSRESKGISFCCAGSINNGSMLSGLRLIMATIQKYKWSF